MKIIRKIPHFESRSYKNKTTRQYRRLELTQLSFAPVCGSVVTGAILAGYLKYIGISDTVTAVLMQLLVCAASMQCIAPLIYMNTRRRITIVRWLYAAWRFLCVTVIFSMFIANPTMKIWVFAILYFTAFVCTYLAEPAYFEYLTNVVPRRMRGRFFGKRDAVSIASTAVSGVLLGYVLDIFRGMNQEGIGFIVLYAVAAVGAAIQVKCLFAMKEMPVSKPKPSLVSPWKRLLEPLQNKKFRKVIIFHILYNVCIYVASSYFSIYLVSVLKLNYAYIAFMSIIMTVMRIIAGNYWGRLGDKKSYSFVLVLSLLILTICHTSFVFVTPATYQFMLPIANMLSGIAWGGLAVGVMNTVIQYAAPKRLTVYLGVNGGIGSATGFLGAVVGAIIANSMLELRFEIAGLAITYMQVMFFGSAVLLLFTAGYVWVFLMDRKKQ